MKRHTAQRVLLGASVSLAAWLGATTLRAEPLEEVFRASEAATAAASGRAAWARRPRSTPSESQAGRRATTIAAAPMASGRKAARTPATARSSGCE